MLQSYLEELRKTPLLEPEEERQLWQQAAEGDLAAHQKLMTSYQPLVFKIAASFKLGEAETMELIQEGMVGLLEAAESYDYTRQVAFSLFASFRIKGSMVDYLRHSDRKGLLYLDSEISQGFTLSDALPSELATPTELTEQKLLQEKVAQAIKRLKKNYKFTAMQEGWIKMIGDYLQHEPVLNKAVFDQDSRFRQKGGFKRIDKMLNN